IQAQAILDLRLHRLTGLERDKIKLEHEQLAERIKELKQLLGSNELIYRVVKDELKEIKKKYNDERRTDITTDISDIEIEDLIPEEENVISISHSGYIKRVPVTTYRKQGRGGRGVTGTDLKEDDFVKHLFIASTHHYIMFFSNLGKVYRLKVHQIPTGSRMSKGKAIVNLLPFVLGEMVAAIIAVKDYGDDQYLVMATKKGIIKKTSIEVYDTSRRDGIIAITIKKEDELIGVEKSNGNNDIIMVSRNGKAIRFSEEDCRPIGRTSQGVKGMKLSKGDEVLSMMVTRELDGDLFVLTENGYGKRTQLSEYKKQNRGGLGVRTLKITEKKGKVAGAGILKDEHDVMIISDRGVLIRIPARSISRIGRSTQGIKAINLEEGAKVASYSIVVSES
ncbi:MAG: DNA gyrase subunit A, partial [Actinobacteria bacterium]|nr:DNA gyrase subunit A [Actinomycetota bacterium]